MPSIRRFTGKRILQGRVGGIYLPPAASSSGPAFRSVATTTTTTSTMTCAMPTGVASGDVLVMQIVIFYDAKSGTLPSAPVGWAVRGSDGSGSGDGWYWRVLTKTAGASETSVAQAGTNWFAGSMSILAVSNASAVDVVGAAGGNTLVAPSVTTTTANGLLIGSWMTAKIGAPRPIIAPASMTSRTTTEVANTWHLTTQVATQTLTASGATGTRTATDSGAANYHECMLLAVK